MFHFCKMWFLLGGWTNPFKKKQLVTLDSCSPIFRVNIKKYWNHHLGFFSNKKTISFTPRMQMMTSAGSVFQKTTCLENHVHTRWNFSECLRNSENPYGHDEKTAGNRPLTSMCIHHIAYMCTTYLQTSTYHTYIAPHINYPLTHNHHVNFMTGNSSSKKHLGVCFVLNLDPPFAARKSRLRKSGKSTCPVLSGSTWSKREGCPKEFFFPKITKQMKKFEAKN